jgi:hypothetical protein
MQNAETKTRSTRYTYRWVHFPRRKNDIRELPEELLVQKQKRQQRAIQKQEARADAAIPEATEHEATHQGSQSTQHC